MTATDPIKRLARLLEVAAEATGNNRLRYAWRILTMPVSPGAPAIDDSAELGEIRALIARGEKRREAIRIVANNVGAGEITKQRWRKKLRAK
jgi:hypothetical protein